MNTPQPLPVYSDEALAGSTTDQLLELLVRDEDRVPRNVIDECARRGDAIVQHLGLVLENHHWDGEASLGEWWRLLHAVMILGLVQTAAAGLLLVQYMRRMSEEEDDALQDWLAGHWPAIFDNKPASLMSAVRALSEDRDFDWYIRACATDAMVAMARRVDTATLDDALTYLAATAQDEAEDWDYRMLAANTLLDFPRPQYRKLLETLAKQQPKIGAFFHQDDVEKSYAKNEDKPDRGRHYKEPWAFYEPQAIAARQERWTKEEQEEREKEKAWETEGNRFEDVSDPYVRPEPKTGRNDPCPCGSGRKYKRCCLNKQEEPGPDDLAWRRLRRALDGLPKAMLRTAREHFGPDAIEEAWAEFNLWDGDEPFSPESPYLQIFLPWHLYDWLPDPEETAVAASAQAETAAAAYLRIAGKRLAPLARHYVEACMTAPFSFHEIVACDPGRSFRLRDVLLGTEVDAIEHEGSVNARAGDLIYAKVVRSDGLTLVEGCTPVLIPPIYKTEIIEFREQLAAQGAFFDDGLLREYEFELREIYLGIADRLLYPRMPQMANTDGDPLEFRELVFDIDSPREAFEALKGLAGVPEDEMPLEAELDTTGALVRTEITWRRADSDTILGTLRINGRRLTAEANSARRADELRRLIEERLGAGGRYRTGTIQSVESLLNREPTPAEQAAARERANENARLAALPEVQAAIAAHLREHYRKWLDEKIPALGDRTPREAVRDPAGREAVAALILQIERDGVGMQPPLDPAIVREMRKALGL